jgi:phage shock protein PspC (stress-responsive transcriptional regulator)
VLGGVAAGLAGYFGVDVAVVRIALIALTLLGGAGVPLYAAGWLVMPDEITRRSVISEMLRPSPDSEVVG